MTLSKLWLVLVFQAALRLPTVVMAQPASVPLEQLLSDRRWPEALAAIDQALKARPKNAELLMNRGAVLLNLNRDAEALQVFRAVAAANPGLPAAHNNMAVILAASGRYDQARTALLQAIKADPRYATAHDNLGDLYAHQAAEAYRKALEIDPSLKSARTKLNLTADIITLATGVRPTGAVAAAQPPAPAAAAAMATPPATPPTVTPASAASPGAKAVPAGEVASVEAAVRDWQRAWTRRDGARYVAAYAEDYRGGTDSAATWRELAQKRLRERSAIRVDIGQLKVDVDGDTATARFEQTYESDQPGSRMRTRKTLVFQKITGRWLIREERRN